MELVVKVDLALVVTTVDLVELVPVVVEPTLVVQPTQLQELAKELVAQVMVMVQVKELVKV